MAADARALVIGRIAGWVVPASEADWDALYAEQMPRVYNFFRYRVGHGPDAEDLTAVTFQKAWQARHRFRRDLGAFTAWLFAIARNVATDHWRRARAHAPLEAAEHVAAPDDPARDAEHAEDLARLGGLLATLAVRERELIALKYGAGLTNRAIARLTGLTESNVGTILHRTVADLRARW
jgi:RNA polymerase sigma-70 factor (ECF subfamily)